MLERLIIWLPVAISFFFLTGCISGAGPVVLVQEGSPRAAVILPDEPLPAQEFAARELIYHVKKASGAELPLYAEKDAPPDYKYFVYIGPCRAAASAGIDVDSMPPSGYTVKTIGNALFLAGRDRDRGFDGYHHHWGAGWQGTLYAVYDFLENDMGVRWLWPGELGEHIPGRAELAAAPADRSGEPRFRQAWVSPAFAAGGHLPGWSSPESKEKYYQAQRIFLLRHRFGSVENLAYCHAFGNYWRRFGETNPAFFAKLPDGTRRHLDGDPSGQYTTMCVSEPSFIEQIISDWRRSPERNPDHIPHRPYVNACENDTPGMCTCERCRAWDAPHPEFETHDYWGKGVIPDISSRGMVGSGMSGGEIEGAESVEAEAPSLSDRYARFYIEVLRKARKVDPEARVAGFAYSNYWKPPVSDGLDLDGVLIIYVPPLWFPYTDEMSADFRKAFEGWNRLGAELYLRPNLTHSGANLPIFYARELAGDFSYAAEHGMVGTYFDSLLGAWSAQGPTMYTLARIHQRPEWTVDQILDEYYAVFGPAEAGVREYFGYWERHSDSLASEDVRRYGQEEKGGTFQNYVRIAHRIFKPENFSAARALLDEARRQAGDDEKALRRVSYLEQGLTDAELTTAARAAQAVMEEDDNSANRDAFEEAFGRLVEHRAVMEAGGDHPANLGMFALREQHGAGWPHLRPPGEEELHREEEFQSRWPEKEERPGPQELNLRLVSSSALPADGWRFRKDSDRGGDLFGWHLPGADVEGWKTVETGAAWESFLGEPYVGAGWYRRSIEAPERLDGRRVYLRFGGVDESCWLWVNGEYAGRHHIGPEGWNVSFRLDITPFLKPGENLLAVRVMNTAWAGGIYRPVRLEVYEPVEQ